MKYSSTNFKFNINSIRYRHHEPVMSGVHIIPYNKSESLFMLEDDYFVIGQELEDGRIKLLQFGYHTYVKKPIYTREEFEERYFTEAL